MVVKVDTVNMKVKSNEHEVGIIFCLNKKKKFFTDNVRLSEILAHKNQD